MSGAGGDLPQDSEAWMARIVAGMLATWRTLARTNGAELFERDGVFALATPGVPERSLFNSSGYTDPEAFLDVREELAAWYEDRACAWTVWVPEGDERVARNLKSAGHLLDAAPRAMGMALAEVSEPDLGDIGWEEGATGTASLINDRAYGYPEGTWGRFNDEGATELRTYTAMSGGEPAATVATIEHGNDCEIWSVATLPEARGRGLATALMRQALWDARQAGCVTATLQATAPGRPVYERVGFSDLGALEMWELRPPELAAQANRRPAA